MLSKISFILLLPLVITLCFADKDYDKLAGRQKALYEQSKLQKFKETVIYVDIEYLNAQNDTLRERATFFPVVDDFSELVIPRSGNRFRGVKTVKVSLNYNGFISEPRFYKKPTTPGAFAGYLTAVVQLINGNITDIVWDDSCDGCGDADCIDLKTCGLNYNDDSLNLDDCQADDKCNIRIYLAWVGNDKNDEPCQSLAYIPSKFQLLALNPMYKSAAQVTKEKFF